MQKSSSTGRRNTSTAVEKVNLLVIDKSKWVKHDECKNCTGCDREFQLFLTWKHNCRFCGKVKCSRCLATRYEGLRVCLPCYEVIQLQCYPEIGDKPPALAKLWVVDKERTQCSSCSTKFNVFTRRHHCRLCGDIFCKDCSSCRMQVGSKDVEASPSKHVRVCLLCFADPYRLSRGIDDIPKATPVKLTSNPRFENAPVSVISETESHFAFDPIDSSDEDEDTKLETDTESSGDEEGRLNVVGDTSGLLSLIAEEDGKQTDADATKPVSKSTEIMAVAQDLQLTQPVLFSEADISPMDMYPSPANNQEDGHLDPVIPSSANSASPTPSSNTSPNKKQVGRPVVIRRKTRHRRAAPSYGTLEVKVQLVAESKKEAPIPVKPPANAVQSTPLSKKDAAIKSRNQAILSKKLIPNASSRKMKLSPSGVLTLTKKQYDSMVARGSLKPSSTSGNAAVLHLSKTGTRRLDNEDALSLRGPLIGKLAVQLTPSIDKATLTMKRQKSKVNTPSTLWLQLLPGDDGKKIAAAVPSIILTAVKFSCPGTGVMLAFTGVKDRSFEMKQASMNLVGTQFWAEILSKKFLPSWSARTVAKVLMQKLPLPLLPPASKKMKSLDCKAGSTIFSCTIEIGTSGQGPAASITPNRLCKKLQKLKAQLGNPSLTLQFQSAANTTSSTSQCKVPLFSVVTTPGDLLTMLMENK